jgi:hypothetical protein
VQWELPGVCGARDHSHALGFLLNRAVLPSPGSADRMSLEAERAFEQDDRAALGEFGKTR